MDEQGSTNPGLLSGLYGGEDLERLVLPRQDYKPFPRVGDRFRWESLPKVLRDGQLKLGEKYLGYQWPFLSATQFMEYARNGNRSNYERLSFSRRDALACLVVAECIEDKGRFLDDIVNGIWAICEESFWGIPAHNYMSDRSNEPLPDVTNPIIDLFAGETGGLMAWTHYLLKERLDAVSPLICRRIELEVKRRILDPFMDRNDFWWMGFGPNASVNNWNPWCNSNCLTAALLMEKDESRRVRAVAKAMESIDKFVGSYLPDGGCDEGTSYWSKAGGSLFDCLELLYGASEGRINVYNVKLIGEIGRYLYRSFISKDYFINFADGGARVQIDANLVFRYGRRIGDENLAALGSSAHHRRENRASRSNGPLLRQLPALWGYEEIEAATSTPPYIQDTWLEGIQVMAARESQGTDTGLYLAAKGGHNAESHNHNDVGQFVVYADGRPMLIDVGVETYTAKTFSSKRYDIWTMQSAYHNLPTVNGMQQYPGGLFKAKNVFYRSDASLAELSLDIAEAYPRQAGIRSWIRTVKLCRGVKDGERAFIEITDDFQLTSKDFGVSLSLMTPWEPKIDKPGEILLLNDAAGKGIRIGLHGVSFNVHGEMIPISDDRLKGAWGDRLFRIALGVGEPTQAGQWSLIITQV